MNATIAHIECDRNIYGHDFQNKCSYNKNTIHKILSYHSADKGSTDTYQNKLQMLFGWHVFSFWIIEKVNFIQINIK